MQRNYLSLAQSRAWGLDYPIGDPFGGAPYGQRAMPVIAVAAAAMSISAGIGLIGTTVLGVAGLGTVIGGALIAGGALSIVGTVTGNKKLSKIGNTLQIVGGVAGFAASATGTLQSATGQTMTMSQATEAGMDKISTGFKNIFSGNAAQPGIATDSFAPTVTEAQRVQTLDVGAANMERASLDAYTAKYNAQQAAIGSGGEWTGPILDTPTASSNLAQYTQATAPQVAGSSAIGGGAPQVAGGAPQVGGGVAKGGGFLGLGVTTGEAAVLGGMVMQGGGAMMSAKAAEKAQEYQATQDEAIRANINSQIIVANSVEEFKRLEAEGAAVMYFPAQRMEAPASPAKTPTTNVWNWNVAATTPVTPTNTSVVGTGNAVLPPTA